MIQVQGLCKRFLDYQRGWKDAITDISFECQPGRDLRAARAQRRGQDDDPADPEHGLEADGRPRDRRGARRARPIPQAVRASIGYMSASTGIYDRMTAWELVEYFGGSTACRASGCASGWKTSSTG